MVFEKFFQSSWSGFQVVDEIKFVFHIFLLQRNAMEVGRKGQNWIAVTVTKNRPRTIPPVSI
jgi:hypothetical protein